MTMNTDRAQAASRHTSIGSMLAFITLWTLMTLSAQAVGRPAMLWLRAPWGGLLAGILAGALQWTLLGEAQRVGLRGSGWWVLATGGAMGIGSLLQRHVAPGLAAVVTEGLVGLAQWRVLRRTLRRSGCWVLLRAGIAWPAASAALLAAAWLAPHNSTTVSQILAGALQGAITGAGTALLLVALLSPGRRLSRVAAEPEAD